MEFNNINIAAIILLAVIGLCIISTAKWLHDAEGRLDIDGLLIVKVCVMVMPMAIAALRLWPEAALATPAIFVVNIFINYASNKVNA